MFLSNPAKSFLASLFILISTAGCGFVGSEENDSAPVVDGPKSKIPFRTKEPESFQCEIVETAGDSVRRIRLAKKGTWRRIDFDPGEKTHRAVLQTDKEYVIEFARGAYAESAAGSGGQFSELTHELLNNLRHAEFEESAREGSIIRYTVRPADSEASEIVVHYDESIGMPVKQEFFSTAGEARTLQFLVELINFRTEPDADAFAVPAVFRKLSMAELLARSN
jgi:hypothetical protein